MLALITASTAVPAMAQPLSLVAFGDSLTQGYGLPQGDGLVPQLQAWLDAHMGPGKVTVINAGVSGDTTAGGRARLDWTLAAPADAMIVALGGNDLLRGLPPAQTRDNLDAILQVTQARGLPVLLAGLHAPANLGPDYVQAFNAIYPELAAQHGTLLLPGLLDSIGALPRDEALRSYMQADGIHPNARGVRLVVEALGPKAEELLRQVKK